MAAKGCITCVLALEVFWVSLTAFLCVCVYHGEFCGFKFTGSFFSLFFVYVYMCLCMCSIVNFILGCKFCSRSGNSLMSPRGCFQNIKQSSKYLFHDLVKSSFMSLPYILPIFSCRFSSKYARVRVEYVGVIFVPMAVPIVWI